MKKRKSKLNRVLLCFKTEAQFLLFLFKPRCKRARLGSHQREIFNEMVEEGMEEEEVEALEDDEDGGDDSEEDEEEECSGGLFDDFGTEGYNEEGNFDHAAGVGKATTARPIRHRESSKETVAKHKELLKGWLSDNDLLLGNGENASSLLKSDSKVLSKLLDLLKKARLEIIQYRAAQANQVEADEALSSAGIHGLFDLLARAVLDGKYPLMHGVWKRFVDMLKNM